MRKFLGKRLSIIVPLLILVAAVALRLWDPPWTRQIQLDVFTQLQRIYPREYNPEVPVRIINIDDETLAKLGQWPWPRTRIAELVEKLTALGAGVIGFDVVFAEPDRTSPRTVVRDWPGAANDTELLTRVGTLPDHDEVLARAIEAAGNVVTGFVLTGGALPRIPALKGNFAVASGLGADDQPESPGTFVRGFTGAIPNLDGLSEAAVGNGNFNMVPEIDGLVRRVPLIASLTVKGEETPRLYPALALEALRVALGGKTMVVKLAGASGEESLGASTGIVEVKVGPIIIPTDSQGHLLLHYTGHRPERYISALEVFDGTVDKAKIEGMILLVGTDAAGLRDQRSTPMDLSVGGVEIHVEALEQMLTQDFLSRPDWMTGAEVLYLIVVGLLLIVLLNAVGALPSALIGLTFAGGAIAASGYAYSDLKLMVDPVYPVVAVILVFITGTTMGYLRTEGEKRMVRQAFSQYLSPALVERLASNPDQLKLGGETREMTILFCDIRGFTSISEAYKSDPQKLTGLINRLLTPLTDVILARQGTIDKYMGDCIMAFWNAPLDDPLQVVNSCDSALNMMAALRAVNEERKKEAEAEGSRYLHLNIGIGINSGECVVGNMGSNQRFDYSVLGDSVNLAARLEGQSKNYGVNIVLGPITAERAAERFAVLELDLIAVKGKAEAVHIYTLLGDADMKADPAFQALSGHHARMLERYRSQDWDGAEAAMAEARAAYPGLMDEFYDLYAERIAEYRIAPPPEGWDGTYVATSK